MADPTGPAPARGGTRTVLLWAGMLSPAVAATAILVFADDVRLLRLGVVAALWTALFAVLGFSALRRRMRDEDERVAELQRVHELELEREVAARHEFELEAENETRRRVAEESGNEIGSLRAELQRLRKTLEPPPGTELAPNGVPSRAASATVRRPVPASAPAENGAGRVEPPEPGGRGAPGGVAPGHTARTVSTSPVPADSGPSTGPEPEFAHPREGQSAQGQRRPHPGTVPSRQPAAGTDGAPAAAHGNARSSPDRGSGPQRVPAGGQAGSQAPPPARRIPGRPSVPSAVVPSGPTGPTGASAAPAEPAAGVNGSGPAQAELDSFGRQPPGPSNAASQPDTDPPPAARTPTSESSGSGDPAEAEPSAGQEPRPVDADGDASPANDRTSQVAAGAHTEGTSVTDLLAAYGNSGEAKRRRRRGD